MKSIVGKMVAYLDKIEMLEKNEETNSEQNLITHVIKPIFTDVLGYKNEWWISESPFIDSRKAVDIKIRDNKETSLLVEVKKASHDFKKEDFEQLANYLNNNDYEYSWGILTNGKRWALFNNKIRTKNSYLERIIFDLELNEKHKGERDVEYINYFTYDKLLKNKHESITTYYRDLQQYKVDFDKNSWAQYRIGIQKFFQYLIDTRKMYFNLGTIRKSEIQAYFKWLATTKSNSQRGKYKEEQKLKRKTVDTQFRYISSFYKTKYRNEPIFNPLSQIKLEDIIEEINDLLNEDDAGTTDFQKELIELVYLLIADRKENIRNKLIFDLFLIGLSRQEIAALPSNPLEGRKLLLSDNRKIELPEKVYNQLNEYMLYKKENKLKSPTLLCSSTSKSLTAAYLSEVINDFIKEVEPTYTIEKIQQYMFKQYLLNTRDVFTLSYITGFSLSRIDGILTKEEIGILAKKDKSLYKKHPFEEFVV